MTSTATTAEAMAGSSGDYPVQLSFDPDQRINRLWGIPIIGWSIRALILIPHYIVLWLLGVVTGLSVLISWIPVLLTGKQNATLVSLYSTTYEYTARVYGYLFFLAAPYPPIVPGPMDYPINLQVDGSGSINRLWGIPFLGLYLRAILIIPHAILLFFLEIAAIFLSIVIWIPILINGRMPSIGYAIYGGFLRITMRVSLYVLLVPVRYPPISIT
ncbi:MAG TPA: DUF4389 domain-containing protein [Candidatus Limnocylindrales bacterium]|nr:DUF4389 domain-containing protein [Candidatus Limnocylindrales bacterium]